MTLLGGLLLCSCNNGNDSSSSADNMGIDITTVSDTVFEKQETESEQTATAKETNDNFSQNRLQEGSASADEVNILIGGEIVAVTTLKPADKERTTTIKAQSKQNTNNAKTTESKGDNSNVMPDDGLNWSPLVPVN